jgi:hypothetical protein
VTLVNKQHLRHFLVHSLQVDDLTVPGLSRVIILVVFTAWPEHGVPDSSVPILLVCLLFSTVFFAS